MAWPASLTVRTLHGKIVAPDVLQTPAVGTVVFHLPFPLRDSPDNVIVGPRRITVPLVNGEFTTDLPAVDDPDISPMNWAYKVVINTDLWKGSFPLQIPIAGAPAVLELADLAPPVTPPVLITYALQGHTHAQYIPYGLLTAKGSLIVADGPGSALEQLVGADGRVLTANSAQPGGIEWAVPGAGGGGGFKGDWNILTTYNPGETVLYRNGYYGTVAGAAAGDAPVVVTDFFAAAPTTTDTTDTGDYGFRGSFEVLQRVRMIAMTWEKAATQIQTPQGMLFYNITDSTTVSLAAATTTGLVTPADVGKFPAPMIADLLPGKTYAAVLLAGAGADAGYRYTPGYAYPQTVGAVRMLAGGFANGHANITVITNPTTNYANVAPRWEQPSTSWTLLGYLDPVVVGNSRAYTSPIIPT
jgi:hypothetical protein